MKKSKKVTVIMYHYVRDLKNSEYPAIKGLDLSLFVEQVHYLKRHYSVITMEELIHAIDSDSWLPHKSALLTFDDAYIDHYTNVFPILKENNLQGSFFPPVKAITENKVLDANKIHYILASAKDEQAVVEDIFIQLGIYRSDYKLRENDYYFNKLAVPNRFDTKEAIFIKRILQLELEEELRGIITDFLFRKFVCSDESEFSRKLYMNLNHMQYMRRNGMYIGNHGYDHYWLASLSRQEQEYEVDKSIEFLKTLGCDISAWVMCYPYGNYNNDTISILQQRGCKLGLTTKVGIADIQSERFEFPRLDTNDIPKQRDAEPNYWYYEAD